MTLNLNAVIFGTDFSVCSQNAGLYAALMAKYFSAKLFVAHAFILSQAAMEVEIDKALVSQQRRDLQSLLSQKLSSLAADSVPLLLDGEPKDALPKLADEHGPSLLVLGTHGGGWVEREIIGSVAERILRSTRWPALTVGPASATRHNGNVAVSSDPVRYRLDGRGGQGGRGCGLTCRDRWGRRSMYSTYRGRSRRSSGQIGRDKKALLWRPRCRVPGQAKEFCNPRSFVEVGNAHEQILKHIKERSIDLLVLGIQKTSHLGLETRTSRAFQIIVKAECPVFTVTG